jgi:RHS repeat-associated protein
LYETRANSPTGLYYSDNSFPDLTYSKTHLTATYYDDYDLNLDNIADYAYSPDADFPGNVVFSHVSGQPTIVMERIIDPALTSDNWTWIESASLYDNYYRVIQTKSSGVQGGTETITNSYSFTGQLLKSKQIQTVKQGTTTLTNTILTHTDYDHAGRVIKMYHKLNTNNEVVLASNSYDELGQLSSKQHNSKTGTQVQKVDYTYNIRGWIKKINEPDLSGTDGDLFGMELFYNEGLSALNGSQMFNGNISGAKWKTAGPSSILKAYGYSYDQLSRLLTSKYAEGPTLNQAVDRYNENLAYDKNGNILTLSRKGQTASGDLDVLTYSYSGLGNRVRSIGDNETDVANRGDFTDYTDGFANLEYYYDKNGNMYLDRNKHLKFEYNLLNLPSRINDTITPTLKTEYIYTATGQKIKQRLSTNNNSTLYNGNMVYSLDGSANGITLSYIITGEGRQKIVSGNPVYEYHIKDHLGNTRVAVDENTPNVASQVDDYYPFGMLHKPKAFDNDNKYLYNGKELQEDLALNMFDYGARFYDPQIGRWHVIDLMSERHYDYTPFAYVFNNPIGKIDYFGLDTFIVDDFGRFTRHGNESETDVLIRGKGFNGDKIKYYKKGEKAGQMKNKVLDNLEKGSIKPISVGDGTILRFDNNSNSEAVFNFLSDNVSSIEFSRVEYNKDGAEKSFVSTSHSSENENFGGRETSEIQDIGILISHAHSHPISNSPNPSSYKESNGQQSGDVGAYQVWQERQGQTIRFFVRYNGVTREFDVYGIRIRQ